MPKVSKPNFTLLLGPAGCGKTQYCTESFEESLKQTKDLLSDDLLFILPTAEHRARTIDLILRCGLPGFFHRRITTFDRALKEFLKLGGIDFATDVTRRMILKEILGRLDLHYFDSAQRSSGFLNLIAHVIVELKENLIRPGELHRRLEILKKEFPEFSPKYDDLCLIYEAYEKELSFQNLTDQHDSLRLLEEGLTRGEFEKPKLMHVWIDGFTDFSKLQLSFIEFLTRHADQITITLTLDQDPLRAPLFELVSETQSALEDIGFSTKWVLGENHRANTNQLKHLERNLFRSSPQSYFKESPSVIPAKAGIHHSGSPTLSEKNIKFFPNTFGDERQAHPEKCSRKSAQRSAPRISASVKAFGDDNSIQIFEATGLLGELEMIAREIKKLVRANHYHFSDIAILFRSTNPYIQVIQSVFRKFEIPFEIHERIRLKTTPIARTLASFLEIFLGNWDRKDLFNFLKSNRINSYQSICELELAALKKGVFKDRAYWLKSFPESEVLKRIAAFEDEFAKLKTANQFSNWIKKMLMSFGLLDFSEQSDEKTRLDRESARRILLLLEELQQKHPRSHNDDFMNCLTQEFLSLMEVDIFSIHSRDKNKVQIYNVSLARQKEYKAVFLAGLLEKQFPIQVKEDPILSDAERRTLNQKGQILKEQLPRQAFERYLFYLAVARAQENLILTYPRFDLEGREALPSFYVDEVCGLFPDLPIKRQPITEVLPSWNEIGTFEEAEALVIRDLWQIPVERVPDQDNHLSFALYDYLIQDPEFQNLLRRLLKPIEGKIEDEKIRPQFKKEVWSPTWLEEYAECPYRFFADRLLKLETQIGGVDIKRRGTILHDVLEHFFAFQRDVKREVSFEEAKKYCLKKFDELWGEEPLGGDRFYRIELERKKMQDIILQILRLELIEKKPPIAGLRPAHFEFEFQDVVLKGEDREIKLRGKIDRIDVDPKAEYALIVDYKYGKTFKPGALENGTSLQLPLYLIAVREKLGLKPLGGHLYSLLKGASSGFHHKDNMMGAGVSTKKYNHYPEKEFEEIISKSVSFAEKFVGQIERGEIPVHPRDCVKFCEYSAICRIEKWRLEHIYREIEEEDRKLVSARQ